MRARLVMVALRSVAFCLLLYFQVFMLALLTLTAVRDCRMGVLVCRTAEGTPHKSEANEEGSVFFRVGAQMGERREIAKGKKSNV